MELDAAHSVDENGTTNQHLTVEPDLFSNLPSGSLCGLFAGIDGSSGERPKARGDNVRTAKAEEHPARAECGYEHAGGALEAHEIALLTETPGVLRPQLSSAMTRFLVTCRRPVPNCLPCVFI